jgi:hypothetical protein
MARLPILYVVAAGLILAAGAGLVIWLWFGRPTEALPPVSSGNEKASKEVSISPKKEVELPAGIQIKFVDVTQAANIHFEHFDGHTEKEYIMETMGSGLGWLDYDQDGRMDLFLVQGSTFVPPHASSLPTCKLYRNLGNGRFEDVTDRVGLAHVGCGQGVAVGDIDNDGFPDLFLTSYGKPNVLYHNEPVDPKDATKGRHFVDISAKAGIGDHPDWKTRPNFSTSAAFLDYNNDGYLDLFVCSYVKIDLAHYPECVSARSGRRYSCQPALFESTRCILYRNNGNGTFTDVSHEAGIDEPAAKALGVVALDLDEDGRVDLFVANDGTPNFFFRNQGNGRFESAGPISGCTVSLEGRRKASMGICADDLDGAGLPDLFVTAFSEETNTLFRNEGRGHFLDVTHGSGLGPPSWYRLGFGVCSLDVDRDGSPDLVVVNGHVSRYIEDEQNPNITFRQPAQLFLNDGRGRFRDLSLRAGDYFRRPQVGRGLASCDYDNDGHMDLAVSNNGEAAVLLHNESTTPYHWIRLELVGTRSNRDAVGAKVTLHLGERKLVRHRAGGGSYLSASDPRLLVGLGSAARVDRVEIRWPSGQVQNVGPLEADRGYRVIEGDSKVTPRP